MSLFQSPPKTKDEALKYQPSKIPPDQVLNYTETQWYKEVYRGENFPQLTFRAVAMGSILGFFLAFTNLYIGLKNGLGMGVAITACILAFAIWRIFLSLGLAKTPLTILETNCMQSTASSAGYATGGTMVSAIAAMLMVSATEENPAGQHIEPIALVAWTAFLGALGTVMAIPMKRSLINQERLKFPSGTAAATTLQSLFSEGSEAIKKAKVLAGSALFGAFFPILLEMKLKAHEVKDALGNIKIEKIPYLHESSKIFDGWLPVFGSHPVEKGVVKNMPSDWLMVFEHNPMMIAAGALVGLRLSFWMLVGSLALIYVIGPMGSEKEWVNPDKVTVLATSAPWKAWKETGLWFGVSIMVIAGLLSFAFQWKTILRSFTKSDQKIYSSESDYVQEAQIEATEVPTSWFVYGILFAGFATILTGHIFFEIPAHYGLLAIFLSFALSLVACRATGESDITPVGAMGKIMQLTYGVLIPQSASANLMTASMTASTAGSAADLLNDLKSGYLLGANPRRQFVAQFIGIFAGTIATVSGFYILVPDATVLLGVDGAAPQFPAPAAQAWKAVAQLFKHGLGHMHPFHQDLIFAGLAVGTVLVLIEHFAPKIKGIPPNILRSMIPSSTGIGLGLILPFQYALSMFIGAMIAYMWQRQNPKTAEEYITSIASGLIAGISIMGVIVAMMNNLVL
jgi:OPT family oligopeptide transporter